MIGHFQQQTIFIYLSHKIGRHPWNLYDYIVFLSLLLINESICSTMPYFALFSPNRYIILACLYFQWIFYAITKYFFRKDFLVFRLLFDKIIEFLVSNSIFCYLFLILFFLQYFSSIGFSIWYQSFIEERKNHLLTSLGFLVIIHDWYSCDIYDLLITGKYYIIMFYLFRIYRLPFDNESNIN